MASDLGRFMETVARHFLGRPQRVRPYRAEPSLRWGKLGARAVDVVKGVWTDHSQEHASINAGGVLDLITRENDAANGEAVGD